MIPPPALAEVSRLGLVAGLKVLQGYRLADTDEAHVGVLLDYMAPEPWTTWVDVGCGFGEVARLMRARCPDLGFVLVNNSYYQLARVPQDFLWLHADMSDLPIETATMDGCMFLYSLCHADDIGLALGEAARVTRPGGGLFVYDYERLGGDNHLMRKRLYAQALSRGALQGMATAAGWAVEMWHNPSGSDAVWRRLFADAAAYEAIFADLRPVLWRAIRR
jgi:ArsR family transcriptional regulator